MITIILCIVAFLTAILTFFSGFGLGTILAPILMIYFPVDVAIAMTGVVHFFNNVFKLFLVGNHANKDVLIRFGVPAIIAALLGSWIMINIVDLPMLFSYQAFGKTWEVYPFKFIIALLLLFFAAMDLLPALRKLEFGKDKLPIGGFLSGFFGGLSGHQGALRSAFLIRAGLSKEAFIGTGVVVSSMVDFTRIGVYATRFTESGLLENVQLIVIVTLSAISGAIIGNRLLKKVTIDFLQVFVAIMLIVISILLAAGII